MRNDLRALGLNSKAGECLTYQPLKQSNFYNDDDTEDENNEHGFLLMVDLLIVIYF